MATVAQLNTYMDAAIAAIDAEDWATAERKLMSAKAIVSTIPNASAVGYGQTWNASAIDSLISDVRAKQSATSGSTGTRGGYRRSDIKIVAEGCSDG